MQPRDTFREGVSETTRAAAVPLLCITLGVLFLVDYRGGPSFAQTWPALLIVGGAIWALAHRSRRPPAPGSDPNQLDAPQPDPMRTSDSSG